ncbi:hypothetical protein [Xenorhabdus miraniensis]|uniref:Uncharacterized protein n=1 Tax=Xenorhabdus miraniensis TaxID=351674 RepID=A0A2D0JNP1_9GAMM|nr:hypothetical protein [Xenorhabdus miraniensis]PHM47286.1 hypothetical protein Xmir_03340 [Xenorhabdus miraniensis]PHM47928.1 hypothetical protein Xmir_02765 [Xenorhabdus miraniensis]
MKTKRIKLYNVLFFIILIIFNNAYANELMSNNVTLDYNYSKSKGNGKVSDLSETYNLTFENKNQLYDLQIKVLNFSCMYETGDKNIILKPNSIHQEEIEDSNSFKPFWWWPWGCEGDDKFLKWNVAIYEYGGVYKSCDIEIRVSFDIWALKWTTAVNIENNNNCQLTITATCDGEDCKNMTVFPAAKNIAITIDDYNAWAPPIITSPKPNSTVENNYITILGKGLMEDGTFPKIRTNFNSYNYSVQSTGDDKNWMGQLWIGCGITGEISIVEIENSEVTLNGPPCGATITSIQNGQTIPAGKYSLSGRVNSDTADHDRNMQVEITGYKRDGTIYSPTANYTPNVDTGTGKWSLEDLDAVCGINYNVSVNAFFMLSDSKPTLPSLVGTNISYRTPDCSIEITNPKDHEVVSSTIYDEQNISISGHAADGKVTVELLDDTEEEINIIEGNAVNNKFEVKDIKIPIGFISIEASDSSNQKSKKVTILSSKVFSVEAKNDSVFTVFSGTSMQNIIGGDKDQDFIPKVEISYDELDFSEEADPDEKGNWKGESKHYAKRGVYIFTFQESNNNRDYAVRDEITLKCTGSDLGMSCVIQ